MLRRILELVLAALAVSSPPALAQVVTGPTLYRLDPPSLYEEGCQSPCSCPINFYDDLFGTFVLTFSVADPAGYVHYHVDQVNWLLIKGGVASHISGQGEYKVGGQFVVQHELQLDLSIDGAAAVHFDSGLVLGGGSFPRIDITVSDNLFCFAHWFDVNASAVPAAQITPYTLVRTLYEEGCLPPCLCPLVRRRALGTFGLVNLGMATDPAKEQYALVDIDWRAGPAPVPLNLSFHGAGIYEIDRNTLQHRLRCDLVDGNAANFRFDSGLVAGGSLFPPKIQVDIAVNGFYCNDRVFRLRATP